MHHKASKITIRRAGSEDTQAVFELARSFATSFVVEEQAFRHSFVELCASPEACLCVAEEQGRVLGYVLGFDHCAFYANGRVAWVEEIVVQASSRRQGVGKMLMQEFEQWSVSRGSKLVALATRRASDFYQALGYEESATYFRKLL